MNRSSSAKAIAVGFLLSVVAGGLLLSRVSFRELGEALATARIGWLVPAAGLFVVAFTVRAWRWSVLLGGTPFWATWHANWIGYFFNATLPLRVGEIARAYVISKNTAVPMTRAISSVLGERLLDLASVVLLFSWFAQRIPMRPAFTRAATFGSVAIVLCVVGGAFVVLKGEAVMAKLRPRLVGRLGEARTEKLHGKLMEIRGGLVTSPRRMVLAIALSAVIWGVTILLASMCLRAFIPDATDLTRPGLVVVMANLGGALPSAPSGLGIVQGFATSALVVPFGVPENIALAYALVWSLFQLLLVLLFGLVSLTRVGLSIREIRTMGSTNHSDSS